MRILWPVMGAFISACVSLRAQNDELFAHDLRFFTPRSYSKELQQLDPIALAKQDLQRGVIRFLGIAGFSIYAPSVGTERCNARSEFIAIIEGTSDVGDERHRQYQEQAMTFASAYNGIVRTHLEREGRIRTFVTCPA